MSRITTIKGEKDKWFNMFKEEIYVSQLPPDIIFDHKLDEALVSEDHSRLKVNKMFQLLHKEPCDHSAIACRALFTTEHLKKEKSNLTSLDKTCPEL